MRLPEDDEDAAKYVREAVQAHPELYFARFVVLGEGASEEVVIPRLAKALGFDLDPSFVAVVPLGGRHVNHLWRLLSDLDVPHATLLDLDWGRSGGGWGRVKTTCQQLVANGRRVEELFQPDSELLARPTGPDGFDLDATDFDDLNEWVQWLRRFGVFFSSPLDLDYSMLRAFETTYCVRDPQGPNADDARGAVLGVRGDGSRYDEAHDAALRWYRYLFLGRGKPSTHMKVLSQLDSATLAADAPEELAALLQHASTRLYGRRDTE